MRESLAFSNGHLTLGQVSTTKGQPHMMDDDMKNRLKVLRAERDWSQADLADELDVSRQAVNAIETGKYDPSLPLAFKIGRLFGLKIEEIFDDGVEHA
jgi:putative transcriptional regulator